MIKRLLAGTITLLTLCTVTFTVAFTAFAPPALAGAGAQIFSANCAACHIGGGNAVSSAKTLKKEALEQYEMNSAEKIIYQVTNGKNAMPSFRGRITDDDIAAVAAYVLAQSEAGW